VAVAGSVVKPGLADFEAVVNIEHNHHHVMVAAENSEIPGLAFANAAAVSSAQNYLAAAVALNFVDWSEQTHS